MTAPLDRARLRELVRYGQRVSTESSIDYGGMADYTIAASTCMRKLSAAIDTVLDALDAAERERDAFKSLMYDEMDANLSFMADAGARPGENIANCLRRLLAERDALAALLREAREFIDTTRDPPYPAGADLADRIDAALAAREPT